MGASATISRRSTLLVFLGLLAALAICYRTLPEQEFIVCWDDGLYVTENPDVRGFDLGKLMTRDYAALYHPLTMLTLAVEYRLWGETPLHFKLTNAFLHLVCSLLVVLFVWSLFPQHVGLGVFSGFVFAVHPQHVESVAWIAERKDVLSTALALLGLRLYLGAGGGDVAARFRDRRYWLSLLCFLFGLLSKPMVVTFPLLLLLVDLYRNGRITRDDLVTKLPHFGLSLVFGLITLRSQVTDPSALAAYAPAPPFAFIEAIAFYAWKGVFPTGLSAVYQRNALDLGVYPWIFALVLIGMGAWAARAGPRSWRGVAFSAGFFLVSIALVSGLIPFASWQFAADRYFYLSSVGLFLFLGLVVSEISDRAPGSMRSKRLLLVALGAAYCVALGVLSLDRMAAWSDCESLWQDVVHTYPRSDWAHDQLGGYYSGHGDDARAAHHFAEALRWQPDNAPVAFSLAVVLDRQGEHREARGLYEDAIEMDPTIWRAHHNLGLLLLKQGLWASAVQHLEQADAAYPGFVWNCHFLGVAQRRMGETDRALRTFRRCLAIHPNHADTLTELAHLHLERGEMHKARRALKAARRQGQRPDPALEPQPRR